MIPRLPGYCQRLSARISEFSGFAWHHNGITGCHRLHTPVHPSYRLLQPRKSIVLGLSYSTAFTERQVQFRTCRHLFSRNDENSGLLFNLTYIDEHCKQESQKKQPVVAMLHGSPGSCQDFEPQIRFLLDHGARVIVPNFPDLDAMLKYRSPKFRNNAINRASLITDFFRALGIQDVDMLVAHSGGAVCAYQLHYDQYSQEMKSDQEVDADQQPPLRIRSLALINVAGHKASFPLNVYSDALEWLTFNRMGYACLNFFNSYLLKSFNKVGNYTHINEPLLSLSTLARQEPLPLVQDLAKRKPVILYIFSNNDRLIKKSSCYEILELLGGRTSDIWIYDSNGHLKAQGSQEGYLRAVCFETGSHYSFRRFPDIVNNELILTLKRSQERMKS